MLAYDSNPVNPHACGASGGCARGTKPSLGAGRCSINSHVGEVRAQRAL
jgi:hypothetical protein